MNHYPSEVLSAFLDGDLLPRQQAEMDSHIAACGECRGKLDDIRSLVGTLQNLPDEPPQQDLWTGIRAGLDPRGVSRMRYRSLAAAAAVVLMLVTAGWLLRGLFQRSSSEARVAETLQQARADGYLEAIRDMEVVLEELEAVLDPASTRLVRKEIAVLDAAIDEVRQALDEDPDNLWLRASLARTLRSKWTYLREAPGLTPPRIAGG